MIGKTEGIILDTLPFGQSRKIFSLFSKEYGMLRLIGPNTSSPLTLYEVIFYEGRKEMHTVKELTTLNAFLNLRKNFDSLQAAGGMLGCLKQCCPNALPSPLLYKLLLQLLTSLPSFAFPATALSFFRLKLLQHEGLLAKDHPLLHIRSIEALQKIELTLSDETHIKFLYKTHSSC